MKSEKFPCRREMYLYLASSLWYDNTIEFPWVQ
jgi:hypothetical protein